MLALAQHGLAVVGAVLALAAPEEALLAKPSSTALSVEVAKTILFAADRAAPPACEAGAEPERIACLVQARFQQDPQAAKVALALYRQTGTVVGLLPEQDFDGAYRGKLHFVPRLPVGEHRKHLEWLAAALAEYDDLFTRLEKRQGKPLGYRWKPLELRFFESVKARTPSAWASDWNVSYNVSGSLFRSAVGVRETLFHELFHLNDFGRRGWSKRSLSAVYDRIVARCGKAVKCLAPYSPDGIIVRVRGGTYYDFMPENGVQEYAADVAKRWFVEHRLLRAGLTVGKPFKCGAPENAEAWKLVVDEFFAGIDDVPACPKAN
ncbi:MAG TPA: hypothetical protein VGK67_11360 [Myxococcales bacterium]|jgi:hypothetical protein